MAEPRHLVLIHGAWQGSWAFADWRPRLEARGWRTHPVDLPGNGWGAGTGATADLDAYTAHVGAVVRGLGAPAVVLGHSGGGITASQVAEALPERVAAVVYLAGMMLPDGQPYSALLQGLAADEPGADLAGIGPWLEWNAERTQSRVPEAAALRCFFHDCDPTAARHAAGLLRPQPESGRAMHNRLSAGRFGRVPRVYVECRDDRSLRLPVQQRMQRTSPGALRLAIDCGHVPQLAQPERLTELLVPVLDALNAGRSPGTAVPSR